MGRSMHSSLVELAFNFWKRLQNTHITKYTICVQKSCGTVSPERGFGVYRFLFFTVLFCFFIAVPTLAGYFIILFAFLYGFPCVM